MLTPFTHNPRRAHFLRRGVSIPLVLFSAVLLAGMASFAIDYSRVWMAKNELRAASIAAARAAMSGLGNVTTVQDLAVKYAAANNCDGTPVVIDPNLDIQFGTWNPVNNSFTVLTGSARSTANAIRIWCIRSRARGNPIPMMFAGVVGRSTCDISNVYATTYLSGSSNAYSIVGINSITLSGSSTESYYSSTGSSGQGMGSIASNGAIKLSGASKISGAAFVGPSGSVTGTNITGGVRSLKSALNYPPGSAGTYATTNDDAKLGKFLNSNKDFSISGGKSLTLPGGHYFVHNWTMSGGSSVSFTGPATIYFYGTFTMSGSTNTFNSIPGNLNIIGVPSPIDGKAPGAVTLSGSSSFVASVYAPQSPITLSGSANIYGTIIGLSVTQSGSSAITAYNDLNLPGTSTMLQLVQ